MSTAPSSTATFGERFAQWRKERRLERLKARAFIEALQAPRNRRDHLGQRGRREAFKGLTCLLRQ